MGPKRGKHYYFPQAGPFIPFPNPNYEKSDFSFFLKNTPILDRLGQNGSKSPEMAPQTPVNGPHTQKLPQKLIEIIKRGGRKKRVTKV